MLEFIVYNGALVTSLVMSFLLLNAVVVSGRGDADDSSNLEIEFKSVQ